MSTAAATAASTSYKQTLRSLISSNLSQYFSSTLAQEADMANIFMALIYTESSFNSSAIGPQLSPSTSSIAKDYWSSTPIQNILSTGTAQQRANAAQGLSALGLCQVMGLYFVRGSSKASGKQTLEASSNPAAQTLLVNPGDNIEALILGDANISKQILAGLIILESKYKIVKGSGNSFSIGNIGFTSKISAAVAGYLGVGKADANGTTPQQYAYNIVRGPKYQIANNGSSGYVASANGATGSSPIITVASGGTQVPVGC
jgi:hypothetical protein